MACILDIANVRVCGLKCWEGMKVDCVQLGMIPQARDGDGLYIFQMGVVILKMHFHIIVAFLACGFKCGHVGHYWLHDVCQSKVLISLFTTLLQILYILLNKLPSTSECGPVLKLSYFKHEG